MPIIDRDLPRLTAHIAQHGSAEGFIPSPKKHRSREESIMQCQLIKWWQMQCRVFGVPELALFSIPNGGGRSGARLGAMMKAEGLRKGAPDLFLAVPKADTDRFEPNGYNGLFLELKRRDGRLSPEQEVFHEILREQGYKVVVCYALMEAINEITAYLK